MQASTSETFKRYQAALRAIEYGRLHSTPEEQAQAQLEYDTATNAWQAERSKLSESAVIQTAQILAREELRKKQEVEYMAKEKTEKVKKIKEAKKPRITVASFLIKQLLKGAKDRKMIVERTMADMVSAGFKTNARGLPIKEDNVSSQLGALLQCIDSERGKNKNPQGWWCSYKKTETDDKIQIETRK